MSIAEKIKAEKEKTAKAKITISENSLNTNYSETSKEYKEIRSQINQLQKDLRSVYGTQFVGAFKFDVTKGYFVATKKGQTFFETISEDEKSELKGMFTEITKTFAEKVAKTEITPKYNF